MRRRGAAVTRHSSHWVRLPTPRAARPSARVRVWCVVAGCVDDAVEQGQCRRRHILLHQRGQSELRVQRDGVQVHGLRDAQRVLPLLSRLPIRAFGSSNPAERDQRSRSTPGSPTSVKLVTLSSSQIPRLRAAPAPAQRPPAGAVRSRWPGGPAGQRRGDSSCATCSAAAISPVVRRDAAHGHKTGRQAARIAQRPPIAETPLRPARARPRRLVPGRPAPASTGRGQDRTARRAHAPGRCTPSARCALPGNVRAP